MGLIQNVLQSFENNDLGYSARKLTAFAIMCIVIWAHKFTTKENLIEVLIIDYATLLVCLGLVTVQQILKLKESKI